MKRKAPSKSAGRSRTVRAKRATAPKRAAAPRGRKAATGRRVSRRNPNAAYRRAAEERAQGLRKSIDAAVRGASRIRAEIEGKISKGLRARARRKK